jgi:hypothetical protein
MNYAESFEEFATKVGPMDLALYAGVGMVLWVLFKDKLSPVQKILGDLVNKAKGLVNINKSDVVPVVVPEVKPVVVGDSSKEDNFFKLVVSWKQTRDLAVTNGCDEAVKVADQMFPYLSPNICIMVGCYTNSIRII